MRRKTNVFVYMLDSSKENQFVVNWHHLIFVSSVVVYNIILTWFDILLKEQKENYAMFTWEYFQTLNYLATSGLHGNLVITH